MDKKPVQTENPLAPDFYDDSAFLKEVSKTIKFLAEKHGLTGNTPTKAILVIAVDSKPVPEMNNMLMLKDHINITGSMDVLLGGITKCINNKDGVLANVIAEAAVDTPYMFVLDNSK